MKSESGEVPLSSAIEALPAQETIRRGESSVMVAPARGGIITSFLPEREKEVLYLNPETLSNSRGNVRGGIPILFPNAGLVDDPRYSLKQHGFARTSDAWKLTKSADGYSFTESLDTPASPEYPYDSTVTLEATLEEDGALRITQTATNRGSEAMPIAMGLHPYFNVPKGSKEKIRFDFPGGDIAEKESKMWIEGGTVSIDNPGTPLSVHIPGHGTLTLTVSDMFKKIWVWSLPDEDFICIEPVMRDVNGLSTDPELVAPGASVSGMLSIQFTPEA